MARIKGWAKTVTRKDTFWKNEEKKIIVHIGAVDLKNTKRFYQVNAYKMIEKRGANVKQIGGTYKGFQSYNDAFKYAQTLMKKYL